MGRIIALDYGMKRTGIAVTDPLKIIATPLETVPTQELINFLMHYFQKEEVECIVVGDPKNLDNSNSEMSKITELFISELQRNFPDKRIARVDERFTSKIAERTLQQSGLRKKARQDKSLIDKISAVIILQGYLEVIS